jgi:hypothetical protein
MSSLTARASAEGHADSVSAHCDVVVIGAGPYGLAATAHLRRISGLDVRVFGEPMSFWEKMPKGMLLRSTWEACHIGFPSGDLTLDRFQEVSGLEFGKPVPLDAFVRYGHWFQQEVAPDVDRRKVVGVSSGPGGFRVDLSDGETIRAGRVVVAAGIDPFASRPAIFERVPRELVTHSSEHSDLGRLAGKRVAVVGGGQSALESAALLHESGADVEVLIRRESITWLRGGTIHRRLGRFKPVFYAQTDVGPLGLSRVVAVPDFFRRLPRPLQDRIAYRSIRPAGARWLVDRLAGVQLTTGVGLTAVDCVAEEVRLVLDDGTERRVDHVIAGTGYRPDIAGYDFLTPELLARIRRVNGYPILRRGLEASVPGLHFVGAPAAWSFGPINRFVSGSWYAASSVAERVRRSSRR